MGTERIRVIQGGARTALQPVAAANENRASRRKPVRRPGLIFPGGVAASIPCMIADMSGTGARLEMQPGWVNPFRGQSSLGERFRLVMRIDRLEIDCEIARIDENEMGVRFVTPSRPVASRN